MYVTKTEDLIYEESVTISKDGLLSIISNMVQILDYNIFNNFMSNKNPQFFPAE